MNLLLDESLSPRLRQRLASLFPVLIHVRDIGLKRASDVTIWDWAKANRYTIVTTDADFAALSGVRGWPPKVVRRILRNAIFRYGSSRNYSGRMPSEFRSLTKTRIPAY